MIPALLPPDEAGRVAALRRYAVLDTLPEQALDDLAILAAHICEVPISLVSLVDEHRQWFKARFGLETPETPREFSFCAHALRQTDLLIVPDATKDARFARNPLVTGAPGIRFYAGAPLVTPEGAVLGTLCVIDRVPRTLTPKQQASLAILARQAMTQLELRRQKRELAENERFVRTIFDSGLEGVEVLGPDGSLRMMNRAGLAMIEAESFEQVEDMSIFPLVVPDDRAKFEALTESVFREESGTLEYQIVGMKGAVRWLETDAAPLHDERGEVTAMLGITRDVTGHKEAEGALRASEERYRTLFEYAPDGLLIADAKGCYLDANPSICRMLGYPRDALIGMYAADVLAEKEVEHIALELGQLQSPPSYCKNWVFRRQDGSLFSAEVTATTTPVDNLLAVIRDYSECRRSEAHYRRIVDCNAQGVLFWNTKGEVTMANDAFLQLVGYDREDLDAKRVNWVKLTPPEYAELDQHNLEELAAKGVCKPYEKEFICKDGSRVPVLTGAAVFEESPGEGVGFVIDLTERKKNEQQALRAQRIESIGTLAGGIAHDLNNSLAPIMMSIAMLEIRFPDPTSQDLLANISSSAQRAADMVRQVLSFARGVGGRRMELQVKHLIRDTEKIANDTFLKNIQVGADVARELWTVVGDPTQLHQVLLNLCVNARDAMPDGGALTLSAQNLTLDAHYAGLDPEARPGPYVLVQVEDTGTGMPPDIVGKIFDPFFTTKEVGQGTGLGLSTSLAIIKSHGGFIRVYSQVGKGTRFEVYLPAQTEPSVGAEAEAASEKPRGLGELILVVDDEAAVRQITQQTLEAFGYRVVVAADGAEAIATYAARFTEIAVVLTDMTMPVIDGVATIRVLQKINPVVRIVGASGMSTNGHAAQAARLGVKHFLSKPFTAEALLKALRQVLSSEG